MNNAFNCYKTYEIIIEDSGVVGKIGDEMLFEIYNENFNPPLSKLTDKLLE